MIRFLVKLLPVLIFMLASCRKEKNTNSVKIVDYIESPASVGSAQPFLFAKGDKLWMSWTQKINDSVHTLQFSALNAEKWTQPSEIARGDDWFVNWADFPAIAENNGNLLAHFLQKSDSATFAYDVHLKLSNNNGQDWNKDFVIHTDSTKTEHGFVTLLPYKEDSFFATWLDGRNTGGGGHNDDHGSTGAMTIRTAIVSSKGIITDETLVDHKTCDCCQTSAAITPKGPVIVYRDRTDDEVRDIYISRLLDGSWTIPKPIYNDHWVINGCPVNGPKAVVYKNTLAVTWFTAADTIPKVTISFSGDSGANFDAPIQIDNGKPIGRVDLVLLDEQNVLVSWMESTEKEAEIKIRKVSKDGTTKEPIVITTLLAARASGFPQLELVNDNVYVAWNHVTKNETTIKIKKIPTHIFN